jgi:hypothetical protein
MFEHVTILLSFVFAIALTHLLTSTTELIWARERVRFSWLQALWALNALLGLLIGWIGMFYLSSAQAHWDMAEIVINFSGAIVQYFSCSLISIRPKEEGIIDMPAFFERQRPAIMTAFVAMMAVGMFENWWDRDLLTGSNNWLLQELLVMPMVVFCLAGFARARWLQGLGGIGLAAMQSYFLFTLAI